MKDLFAAFRPKQYIKNLFIFLPIIFGKKFFSSPESFNTVIAFLLFSIAASAVYLVNDVLDIESDRRHPLKRLRPIASGKVPIPQALMAALVLGVTSLFFSFMLNLHLGWIVVSYLILNLLYSRFLKNKVIVDVGCLGVFFLMRIAAGSVIAGVELSHWIIFMTALLAIFLGFNKRRQEIQLLKTDTSYRKVLQEYDDYFIDQMIAVVTSSIVVVYMLYTVDQETVSRVGTNHLIFSIPFVYYGIFRYLYHIHKVHADGDPTTMLLSDVRMQINIALWITVCVAVVYFGF